MSAARMRLLTAGIANEDIHEEAFASPATSIGSIKAPPQSGPFSVHFTKSDVIAHWTKESGSLLDLAETSGLVLPANCRGGACGTCSQTVQLGEVAYTTDPAISTGGQQHLLCCSVPISDVKIEA
jgi:ferredoxin